MKRFAAVVLMSTSLLSGGCSGQTQQRSTNKQPEATGLVVQEMAGGSMVTNLGYGIQVNKGSTLQRRWFIINDANSPIQLSSTGVQTKYESRQYSGDYKYEPSGTAAASHALSAYEIRFLLFDVWGEHMQTLSLTKVSDVNGSFGLSDAGSWRAWESDVRELETVVSFVAHAKTVDGRIWTYDPNKLLRELERVKVKLTEKELNPEREKPKS